MASSAENMPVLNLKVHNLENVVDESVNAFDRLWLDPSSNHRQANTSHLQRPCPRFGRLPQIDSFQVCVPLFFIFWMNTNYILSVYDPDVAWHFCLIPRQIHCW